MQSQLAKKIDTRYVPRLTFELDSGVKKSLEVAKILHDLEMERQRQSVNSEASEAPSDPPIAAAD